MTSALTGWTDQTWKCAVKIKRRLGWLSTLLPIVIVTSYSVASLVTIQRTIGEIVGDSIVELLVTVGAICLLAYTLNRSLERDRTGSRSKFIADMQARLQGIAGNPLKLSLFAGLVCWMLLLLGHGAAVVLMDRTLNLRATNIAFLGSAAASVPICYVVSWYLVRSMKNLLVQMQ